MTPRAFFFQPNGTMFEVLHRQPSSKPVPVASFLYEAQASALTTTLNHLDQSVEESRTLIRRQHAQLQSVGSMLFALMREVRVVDGPNLDVKCTPAFPQRWHEAMELLIVLANQGIPRSTVPEVEPWPKSKTVETVTPTPAPSTSSSSAAPPPAGSAVNVKPSDN